jgi:hypothetical protein
MLYNVGHKSMDDRREKKVRIGVRIPVSLNEWLLRRAHKDHGDDLTAALIFALSKAQEIIVKEEGWAAEGWLKEWSAKRGRERPTG